MKKLPAEFRPDELSEKVQLIEELIEKEGSTNKANEEQKKHKEKEKEKAEDIRNFFVHF